MRSGPPLLAGLGLVLVLAARTGAGADLAVVDTHIHYGQEAWAAYSPGAIVALLDGAGVRRAFVSSTPDDGTLMLHQAAPDRVVPVLRPYRRAGEAGTWHGDGSVLPYLEERLRLGVHRGIGEFHLDGGAARSPVVRRVAELAERHGLFLHCHCDVEAAEILLGLPGSVPVLWAHAGMSAGPDTVGRLLDASPRLHAELALRSDVAPGGVLDPAWRALFLRHPDRFTVGTDTWVVSRWADLPGVQAFIRGWLGQLPADVAERIASGNAERLARGRP